MSVWVCYGQKSLISTAILPAVYSEVGTLHGGARGVVVGNETRRLEFKSWTRMIAFHIALIPLGKVWIENILPPAMGK